MKMHAPVLAVRSVFPVDLCSDLIAIFDRTGGESFSDVLSINGKPLFPMASGFKQRSDVTINDATLIGRCRMTFERQLLPMILQAFAFEVTQIERYLVGCYGVGGHFGAHCDNNLPFNAHRKFAVTVVLNEDYEGGALRFPDWDADYVLPAGGAIVFSCSLMHEVMPITKGKRYAFLSFFFDNEGARIRYAVAAQTKMLTEAAAKQAASPQ